MAYEAALPDLKGVCHRYVAAQLRGDRKEALRLVIEEGLSQGAAPLDVQLEVIQAAQREIGRMWQENVISIAEEHMATAISQMALSHLYDHAPRAGANGKKVIVACVEGELHDFPARLVADAFDLAGFDVRYLGANVPSESLAALVRAQKPDLLALSATMVFNVPALRQAVAQVRGTLLAETPPIVIGGGACSWIKGLAEELGAAATACDAAQAVTAACRLLGVQRP